MKRSFLFLVAFLFSIAMLDPSRIICCEAMLGLGMPKAEAATPATDAMPCHGMAEKVLAKPDKDKHAGRQCLFGSACAKCISMACMPSYAGKPSPETVPMRSLRPAHQDFIAYIVELSTPPPKQA
ncbi:hypothetical protein GC177_06630 [bacterium]|nr:hypothetical protein [bacterium]